MKNSFAIKMVVLTVILACNASAQTARRTSYGILIDNTGSLRSQADRQLETAKAAAKRANALGAPVSVFGFVSTASTANIGAGLECSSANEEITKQIGGIVTVPGQTTLIDAIDIAAGRIKKPASAACPQADDHVLVLLSDGEDRASAMKADDLFKSLRASGVKVYVVALLSDLNVERGFLAKSPRAKSEDFLKKLASETGGRIVFPKKKESGQEIVDRLFDAKPDK